MQPAPKKKPVKGKASAKKPKLTLDQRRELLRQRYHARFLKEVFEGVGFLPMTALTNVEFVFKGKKCDFDRVYVKDNLIVLVEETYTNASGLPDHLVGKKTIFDYINGDRSAFVAYMRSEFPSVSKALPAKFHDHQVQLRIVYAPLNRLKDSSKAHVKDVLFLDNHILKYFVQLVRAIRKSALYEILAFLSIRPIEYAENVGLAKTASTPFSGSVLPSHQSHFPPGFRVVSFYTSAAQLMQRSYVLRKNSWRDTSGAYQRALSRKKIDLIRRFLLAKDGTFVNNIIATLPANSHLQTVDGVSVNPEILKEVQPIDLRLPNEFNSVGLIDGQHRVFSYYEGGPDENDMAVLRDQQNLLVTGIVFPETLSQIERDRFSAQLFLQINSRQTKPPPELIQEIDVLLRPNAVTSIARRVLRVLMDRGPLEGEFVSPTSESGRIKTASVVNYALVPLVRPGGLESLFPRWQGQSKNLLASAKPTDASASEALAEYVDFCVIEINKFVGAVKANLPKERWAAAHKDSPGYLSVTFVNGLLHALRRLSASDSLADADTYREKLSDIASFSFQDYTSSSYSDMGAEIAEKYFAVAKLTSIEVLGPTASPAPS